METAAEAQTRLYFKWVERGNGWQVYNAPVQLESPLEPLEYSPRSQSGFRDDGKRDTLFGWAKKEIGKLFQKPAEEKQEVPKTGYSYPDRPVPFKLDAPLIGFRVSLPKKREVHRDEAEKLLHMLAYTVSHLSFEIFGTVEAVHIQWTCRTPDKERLISQLRSYFPLLAITEFSPAELPLLGKTPVMVVELGLEEEFILPLNSPSSFSLDPLIGILGAMEGLTYGEVGWVQILFQGAINAWAGPVAEAVSDGAGGSIFVDMPDMPKLAQEKLSSPLYGVSMRVIAQGQTNERVQQIAAGITHSIIANTKSQYNRLAPLTNGPSFEILIENVLERTSNRLGFLLNSKELVNLVHIPSSSVTTSKLARQTVKTKVLPTALRDGRYALGSNIHLSTEHTVWIIDEQRLRHMHIIGATGTGKSTLITNMVLQDCDAGNGCIVFDPHGDLIDDIIPRIGEERLSDIILIDPSDAEYPIGFNLLEAKTELEKMILSSDLVETFREKSTAWGDTMTAVLTNAINAFLESSRRGTLLELRKFLLDAKFRYGILHTIEDPAIRSYWQHEFPQLKKGALGPLLTRIDTFLRNKLVRNMLAQNRGIDFKDVLAKNKIVLVKLSQGLIGEENSYLLGTILLSKLYQAAQARQNILKPGRSPYYCYIDEFHNFITPSLSAILSGARKYGLGLILAHQELSQIQDTAIGNSVLSNPAIRVCFRVGDKDAQQLEKGFSYFDANDLQNLSVGEAIVRIERSDWDFNMKTGIPSMEDMEESNFPSIQEQTRVKYATSLTEIETIVSEIYNFEPSTPKIKEQKVLKPLVVEQPEVFIPVSNIEETIEVQVLNSSPTLDIEIEGRKFITTNKEQREKREHLYMQDYVKKMAEQRGFKAQLEAPTPNSGRIDILLIRDELTIACELSVTNTIEYEVKNLQKCIAAGYTNIVMLCSNETHLRKIREAARDLPSEVHFLNPESLYKYIDSFNTRESVKETRIKGYRVKTIYNH